MKISDSKVLNIKTTDEARAGGDTKNSGGGPRLPLLPNNEGVYLSDNHSFIPTSQGETTTVKKSTVLLHIYLYLSSTSILLYLNK